MRQRGQRDDHLGVGLGHAVVGDHRRLDPALRELAQKLQRDVRHDLDVHPGVIVDLHPGDRIHVRDVPPALDLVVAIDAADQAAKLLVLPHRDVDSHAGDCLDRSQARFALGLARPGLLDLDFEVRLELGIRLRLSGVSLAFHRRELSRVARRPVTR